MSDNLIDSLFSAARRESNDLRDLLNNAAEALCIASYARSLHAHTLDLADGSGVFIDAASLRKYAEAFNALGVVLGELDRAEVRDERG